MYLDNDSARKTTYVRLLRSQGFTASEKPDGSVVFKKKDVELELQPLSADYQARAAQPLLAKMEQPDVDGVIYLGHSYYGALLDHAYDGPVPSGEGKLVALLSCDADVTVDEFQRRMPGVQLIGTRATTESVTDDPLLVELLAGLGARRDWKSIERRAVTAGSMAMKGVAGYEGFDLRQHYFFPHRRDLLSKMADRDSDGVADVRDAAFTRVRAAPESKLSSYAAGRSAGGPVDGAAVTRTAALLDQMVREVEVPSEVTRGVPWGEHTFVAGGFFEPRGSEAVRFERDGKQVVVKVSKRFAHSSEVALSRMAAYELGRWAARESGLGDEVQLAAGLGLLSRMLYQFAAAEWTDPRESAHEHEAALRARYGLGAMTFKTLNAVTGEKDYFEEKHYRKLLAWVREHPAVVAQATQAASSLSPRGERAGVREAARVSNQTLDVSRGVSR
jgi:hypothetical protein